MNHFLKLGAAALLSTTALAGIAKADQVFNDDVIVDGSLCVGFDCVNGENFGFDTIRLKENNLRVHFQDTSNSASFPTNDWRIIINETTNGGDNKFSIEDSTGGRLPFTIEASAPSDSLYVDDGGRIGVGTGSPVVEVHIKDGDTPTLRLEQDGSSGFTPQTWDLAGNETNFFVRDVTNGSRLPFRIRPNAPTNSINIANDGDVGLGTDSPSAALHMRRTDNTGKLLIEDTGAGFQTQIELIKAGTPRIRFDNSDIDNAPPSGNNLPAEWDIGLDASGDFIFRSIEANSNVFLLDDTGALTISGQITTGGTTCGSGCDLVFSNDYELRSLSEHNALMWSNGYLPNVGPTKENEPFNLTDKLGRMLNELEHAHIYIGQLHQRLSELETKIN